MKVERTHPNYLRDILDAVEKALQFTSGMDSAQFHTDERTNLASSVHWGLLPGKRERAQRRPKRGRRDRDAGAPRLKHFRVFEANHKSHEFSRSNSRGGSHARPAALFAGESKAGKAKKATASNTHFKASLDKLGKLR